MSAFVIDYGSPEAARRFGALDAFTQGYLEAAFWLTTDWGDPDDSSNPNEHPEWSVDMLAPEAIAQATADCADFQAANAEDLAATGADDNRNGVDFWLTRNRHGAGFWDRGYGAVGDRLTANAHPYGETDLYRGDDGRLYLS